VYGAFLGSFYSPFGRRYDANYDALDRYHHLNHYALFGGGYQNSAMRIMKELIEKYGGGS
jgi:protein-ribulosamine 3-kinase